MSSLTLREASSGDESAIRLAIQKWEAHPGFMFVRGFEEGKSYSEILRNLDDAKRGKNLPAGFVPDSTYFAFVDGVVVGRSNLRHTLNDHLALVGGHIGYGVLSEFRRRGYATEILRQTLPFAKNLGLDKVLLTCDDNNIGSVLAIERCGGKLENKITVDSSGLSTIKRRYWIDL